MAINPDTFPETVKITPIVLPETIQANIQLDLLRLDLIHPEISGNKWFKLKYNLTAAFKAGKEKVLTFGGPWSNHLAATAAAAKETGMKSAAIIRGLHWEQQLTPTLLQCRESGMDLRFVSKETYTQKYEADYLTNITRAYPDCFIIPEGGNNEAGRRGAADICTFIPETTNVVCLALGTGTTFAGIRCGLAPHVQMIGFPVMKGGQYLETGWKGIMGTAWENAVINSQYHFGGFGKHPEELIDFMNLFYRHTGVPLDVVYNAKSMYGLLQMIQSGYFTAGTHITAIHTGGLQGNASIKKQLIF